MLTAHAVGIWGTRRLIQTLSDKDTTMLFSLSFAAATVFLCLPWNADAVDFPRHVDIPIETYQLGLIKQDDVVDVMITSRERPAGGLQTSCYAQIARVISVSTAPHAMARLSTDSGLSPSTVKEAIKRHGRVRLLLRGAGDRLHNTHLGILSREALEDYARKGVPMIDLLAAATATSFDSMALREFPAGTTASGIHIPFDWRGFPLRLVSTQQTPRPGEHVDVSVSYSGGSMKSLSLWKRVPIIGVTHHEGKPKHDVAWLALPAGAARVLTYALDGLPTQDVKLTRSGD